MPGRKSHGQPLLKKHKPRNKSKARSLFALSIASQLAPEKIKIRQHRLGTQEGSSKIKKRIRDSNNEDDEDEEDQIKKKQRKGPTRTTSNELDLDEGSDSDGNEWKLGHVDTDDDSDLDSDEAFGESDEERFDGFAFSGSKKKPKKKSSKARTNDLNEEDSEDSGSQTEESELGEGAVDLATILDDEFSDSETEITQGPSSERKKNNSADRINSDDNSDDKIEDDSEMSSSDDGIDFGEDRDENLDPTKVAALQNLISNLSQNSGPYAHENKNSNLGYNQTLPSSFGVVSNQKLTLEDLGLPTVVDPHLKKSLKILDPNGKKNTGKLEVPLERRQQDRIDRSVAYEKSKETLDRWIDTVKLNRRSEHITFPLADHGLASAKSNIELAPINPLKPHNDLEATIQSILEESGLATVDGKNDEDHLLEFEELETNKMSLEEIKSRRYQLRMARELLYREEARSKRIKKIKSKSYRKVHRKQREKLARLEQQTHEDGTVPIEDELDSIDRRRAEGRMRARHKGSKWSKAMKETGRSVWDKDVRSEIAEMASRDEELRKRIEGKKIRKEFEDSDASDTSNDTDDENSGTEELSKKQQILQDLNGNAHTELIDTSIPGARLANMDFMRKASLALKKKNDAIVEEIRREIDGKSSDELSEEDGDIGRRVFGQHTEEKLENSRYIPPRELEKVISSNAGEDSVVSIPIETEPTSSLKPRQKKPLRNSWDSRKLGKNLDAVQDPEGGAWSISSSKTNGVINSASLKRSKKREIVNVDELDLSKTVSISRQNKLSEPNKSKKSPEDSDSDSTHSVPLTHDQELIRRAFAGADVVGEFEVEKKKTVIDEGDKTIDQTLPGWGNWVGEGISKRELKRNRNRFVSTSEGVKAHKRKDATLERVIINEKKVKKNSKYLASSLPHPFESRSQYERALRLPIGPEWTTKQTFQDATKPRILLRQGIITPMLQPLL
ncbi:hypothetical protein Golomagni_02950 [Golovinomyces magnicellulatus]|nr:hypothetical protein Golomagni_02950 [Golovinomyces magnicellulatus]